MGAGTHYTRVVVVVHNVGAPGICGGVTRFEKAGILKS
jgi:hypothetical protein